jgi:twitching motility protein PilU
MPAVVPTLDMLFEECVRRKASDIYLTVGSPPAVRVHEAIIPLDDKPLANDDILNLMRSCLSKELIDEFNMSLEMNTSIGWQDRARFRINMFRQRQYVGVVIRRIETYIPALDELMLPPVYASLAMERRGLILVVGPSGSGKSTALASMIAHRNRNGAGHILTVEDPIEFLHEHNRCIITQRDVGVDTLSFNAALKNALRQRPDVVMIGEIRDRETMEHALTFAETGHLCMATLHAASAAVAIERVVTLFPEERHKQIFAMLSHNLRAIFCQRLVQSLDGSKVPAVELLLNEGFMRNLVLEGRIKEIPELMSKNKDHGMRTLDQSLFTLYEQGRISEATAVAEAHVQADIRLMIKQVETSKFMRKSEPLRAARPDAF